MQPLAPLGDGGHVRKDQLGVDDLDVAHRIDGPCDVVDVVVFKAADDLHDGVHLADVAQELVAEPFSLACALHEAGDIDELNDCGDELLGMGNLGKSGEPGIGHNHDALVGVDGAKRIVRGLRFARPRHCVKKGGFTHVGEPDNTCA